MYKTITILIFICGLTLLSTAQNNQTVKDDPKGAWEFERMRTADPLTGEIPYEKYEQARKSALQQILKQQEEGTRDFGNWTERGPNNFGGRTRAIMWDPNVPNKVWAGGVDGGIWANEDITDEDSDWNLVLDLGIGFSISTVTFDPNNTTHFYFGTGEFWSITTSTYKHNGGGGIWKSEDGGNSWDKIDQGIENEDISFINVLKVSGNILYAGTDKGLYLLQDGVWDKDNDNIVTDIEVSENNTIYLTTIHPVPDPNNEPWYITQIYKRIPNSSSYSLITPDNIGLDAFRVELSVYNNNPDTLYAIGVEHNSYDGDDVIHILLEQ